MASRELRRAWADLILPEDYEQHMAAIGQAEANAYLTKDLIDSHPLPSGSHLMFAGAGPGQMFDFVSPDFLATMKVTFTDISQKFLDKLEVRLAKTTLTNYRCVIDDIEDPHLRRVDAVVIVLVLEHVEWEKALLSLVSSGSTRLYIIVQLNPVGMTDAVTPKRVLPGTLANISPEARPVLVDPDALIQTMKAMGFGVTVRKDAPVPDGKSMVGFIFEREATIGG